MESREKTKWKDIAVWEADTYISLCLAIQKTNVKD